MNVMYSCKRVAELISQGLDEPLGLVDQMLLRMHLSLCNNCSNVEQQLLAMRSLSEPEAPCAARAAEGDRPAPPEAGG